MFTQWRRRCRSGPVGEGKEPMRGIIRRNECGVTRKRERPASEGGPYKSLGLIFGPAEGGECVLEAGEGEADHIEVAAFDARYVASGAALDGVAASFIVGFASGKVAGDFFGGEQIELNQRGLDKGEALGVGKADEGDAGDDGVGAARKFFEHVTGVVGRAGFAEDVAFESDFGVGADDDGGANGARGDRFGFGESEALDEVMCGFAGVGRFVDGGGEHGEGEPGFVKDFGPADGGGSENELHRDCWTGRILQRQSRYSLCFGSAEVSGSVSGNATTRHNPIKRDYAFNSKS
jgi:hypothetical protein